MSGAEGGKEDKRKHIRSCPSLALPRGTREQLNSQARRYQDAICMDFDSVSFPRQSSGLHTHSCPNIHSWLNCRDGNGGLKENQRPYIEYTLADVSVGNPKVFYFNGANLGNHKISMV